MSVNVPLLWTAVVLASYRVWRLAAGDDITEPFRRRVFRLDYHKPPGTAPLVRIAHRFRYAYVLVSCHWCLGTWVAIGVCAVTHVFAADLLTGEVHSRTVLLGVVFAAIATLDGLIGQNLDD